MRRLHIVLLSLAIAMGVAGTNAWAQRGAGGHGGGGSHGGGGGGFRGGYGGGGFRFGSGGGGFRGGYGGYRGGYGGRGYGYGYHGWGGWGYGFGFGYGWGPWAYWPYWDYGYYGGWGYPYYLYYPNYSSNPCYPYGPYDCRISGYGPVASAPDPAPAGPSAVAHSQASVAPVTPNAYMGDGQWHHFGPQPAPAMGASSPQITPHSPTSEPTRSYDASVAEAP